VNPNVIVADTSGLNTHGNELSAPVGSTAVADNVTFSRERLPELRRGFKDFSSNLPDFAPEQLLTGSNGSDKYLHLDGGLWYYDTATSMWLRKRGANGLSTLAIFVWADASTIFFPDTASNVIASVNRTSGAVSIVAGRRGVSGFTNGTGDVARFNAPRGIWGDGAGNLYVADTSNNAVRKVTTAGVVTTFASSVTGAYALWGDAATGDLYVSCTDDVIRKVTSGGVVSVFAGSPGVSDVTDGTGGAARFNAPEGIWGDSAGDLYVADRNNDSIRKVTYPGAVVTTFAGSTAGASGYTDATGTAARFNAPRGIWGDGAGNLYVADCDNHRIRKVTYPGAVVTTFAGGGVEGVDGIGSAAGFSGSSLLTSVFVDPDGNLLVSDFPRVRKIYISTAHVTTLLGSFAHTVINVAGFADGIFEGPD
jgi:hypothetical protein